MMALSVGWVLVSIIITYLGYAHCVAYSVSRELKCSEEGVCSVVIHEQGRILDVHAFMRSELLTATQMMLQDGEAVPIPPSLSRKEKRRTEYTYTLTVMDTSKQADGEGPPTKDIPMTSWRLSRSVSKRRVNAVKNYLNGQETAINLREGYSWTWLGVILFIVGVTSLILSFFLGEFNANRAVKKLG